MRTMTEMIPVRDGIHLCSNIFMPDGEGPFATILLRNPYVITNEPAQIENDRNNSAEMVNAGFAVVYQHCRGKGGSEGEFIPFVGEREDGLDTIAWIEQQPWFDGRLYLWGGSYLCYVLLSFINAAPACVKGAVLGIMSDDVREAMYKGGAFKADILPIWYPSVYHYGQWKMDVREAYEKHWQELPAKNYIQNIYGYDVPRFNEIFLCGPYGPDACPGSFSQATGALKDCKIPVLLLDGWCEMFFQGMEKMWRELPEETRKQSAFICGPWSHGLSVNEGWCYPFTNGNRGTPTCEWFEYLRDGKPLSTVTLGKLNYYHSGADTWETADDFPQGTATKKYFLSNEGLVDTMPAGGQWNFTFDPKNPASFPGGPNTFCTGETGHAKQPEPDFRPDVKSFMTAPLTEALDMVGNVRAVLTVGSTAPATMFLCRLCVVEENGNATVIQDAPFVVDSFLSGRPKRIICETGPLCWKLLPGQRLRLDVTSSDAHSYRVHTNTQGLWWEQETCKVAKNTVYFGDSVLEIPTV